MFSQVGLGWSCGLGSGLVVARREEDDSWSPPSALTAFSAGWGLQVRPPSIEQIGGMPSPVALAAATTLSRAPPVCGTGASHIWTQVHQRARNDPQLTAKTEHAHTRILAIPTTP